MNLMKTVHGAKAVWTGWLLVAGVGSGLGADIGREVSMTERWADGEEHVRSAGELFDLGRRLFEANWTWQEGGGRPLTKGSGGPLSDPTDPLVFPRNFNRVSAPDANSCAGCHNAPFGIAGGGGDIVANVFVLGQRFDFATFGGEDEIPTKSSVDERGMRVTLQTIANSRATLGMFGAGYIELLAREMTVELRALRDGLSAGARVPLVSKGVAFGELGRGADGSWDVSAVSGLPASSLGTSGPDRPPGLEVRPFHQAGRVISLREFTNNAFNHHHGIQSTERFGIGEDPDGDGYVDEMTRAEVTAASVFQAALPVPGRVIPNDPEVEEAVLTGEIKFQEVGCAVCHVPALPIEGGSLFAEPNPFNPPGNLRPGEAEARVVDLADPAFPGRRLAAGADGVVWVSAFTDLRLHDITTGGPEDPHREPLDMQHAGGSDGFFAGNSRFLTRKLWDVGNKPNHFHHGQYTTLRESVLAHAGDATEARTAFDGLTAFEQDCVIEFLKTLQVLPPGIATESGIVDEHGQPKVWPPNRLLSIGHEDGQVVVVWQGSTGLGPRRRYQLQRCPDLGEGWNDVGGPTEETQFVAPAVDGKEFYRVILLDE